MEVPVNQLRDVSVLQDFSDAFHRRIPFMTMHGLASIKPPFFFDAELGERFRRLAHYPPVFPNLISRRDLGKNAITLKS
jgi:hypothetical protein